MSNKKYVDIEKVFKEKNASAYKLTPSFIINYIKRILHEDVINDFQNRAANLRGFEYCKAAIKEVGVTVTYTGLEHTPTTGGFIVASNHPLGGVDGMALLDTFSNVRKDIRFIVNDLLKNLENFGELFVATNKLGSNAMENIRRIEAEFASDRGILIFPAGLVSRRTNGVIKDLDWNKSFITKSIKYGTPVIPVYCSGRLSNWFYNLSSFRKTLGIKANVEMLYLVDEMYDKVLDKIHVTIGKPIPASTFTKDTKPQEWANIVRDYVYELQNNATLTFEQFLQK